MPCAGSLMGRFCPRAEVAADRLLSHRRCARSWCRGSAASLNVRIGLPQRAPRSSRGGGENSRGARTDWFQQLKKRGKRAFYFFPSQFHFCLKSYDRHAKLQPSDCDATCLTATPAEKKIRKPLTCRPPSPTRTRQDAAQLATYSASRPCDRRLGGSALDRRPIRCRQTIHQGGAQPADGGTAARPCCIRRCFRCRPFSCRLGIRSDLGG